MIVEGIKQGLCIILLGICLIVSGLSLMRVVELGDRVAQLEKQIAVRESRLEEIRETQLALLELFESVFSKD